MLKLNFNYIPLFSDIYYPLLIMINRLGDDILLLFTDYLNDLDSTNLLNICHCLRQVGCKQLYRVKKFLPYTHIQKCQHIITRVTCSR